MNSLSIPYWPLISIVNNPVYFCNLCLKNVEQIFMEILFYSINKKYSSCKAQKVMHNRNDPNGLAQKTVFEAMQLIDISVISNL